MRAEEIQISNDGGSIEDYYRELAKKVRSNETVTILGDLALNLAVFSSITGAAAPATGAESMFAANQEALARTLEATVVTVKSGDALRSESH